MTIAKPNFDELSPDLRYKIWEKQNRGAIAKAGLAKVVSAIASKAYWIALTPFAAYVAIAPVNDLVSSAQWVKGIWDLNPVGSIGKVELNELDDSQKQVASDIIATGKAMGMSERDTRTALMVAQQESGMRNLDHGDDWYFAATGGGKSDSIGVFQQRDSWGDRTCRTDVKCSARLFYSALSQDKNRDSKAEWEAAADVQRPAAEYRHHYAQHKDLADRILKSAKQKPSIKAFPIAGKTWDSSEKASPYGDRIHPITGVKTFHYGTDLAVLQGSAIVSPEDGTVTEAGIKADSCGGRVAITFTDGTGIRYCHLSAVSVNINQSVKAGDRVASSGGEVGAIGSGGSTGAHLHVERYEGAVVVSPDKYLEDLR
jgi:murein DD-endopeptidase MepM/ murein hydrolase activator NlpD